MVIFEKAKEQLDLFLLEIGKDFMWESLICAAMS